MRGSLVILISSFLVVCKFVVIPFLSTCTKDELYLFAVIFLSWEFLFGMVTLISYKADYDNFLDSKFPAKWLSLSAWTVYLASVSYKGILPTLKKVVKFFDEWFSI